MFWLYFLGVSLIVFDQITKSIAVRELMGKQSIVIIDGLLSLTYVENRGAAYGILKDFRMVLLVVTVFLIAFLIYLFFNTEKFFNNKYAKLMIMFILAGAIGNMIDRVFLGYVVDFLQFTFIDFPVFNFADICVVCGSFMLMLISFKE